jgi:uncharacterized membrane protein YgdD (TMEM256/DUF423 family)
VLIAAAVVEPAMLLALALQLWHCGELCVRQLDAGCTLHVSTPAGGVLTCVL